MTEKEIQERIQHGRNFMHNWEERPKDYATDQQLKKPQPPLTKAKMSDVQISLPTNFEDLPIKNNFLEIINTRKSHRVYTQETMSLLQLSYLLWCTQGVKEIRGKSYATLRTVPCGGGRHEFEAYMAIQNVEGLKDGYYHYLPMTHEIELLSECNNMTQFISDSLCGQAWACKANVVFYYSMVAYRAEWRYGIFTHRVALIDSGYISENLYLACTSIGIGSCAIGAIADTICNSAFNLDGNEEFIILAHPVGMISEKDAQAELDFYAFVKEQGL